MSLIVAEQHLVHTNGKYSNTANNKKNYSAQRKMTNKNQVNYQNHMSMDKWKACVSEWWKICLRYGKQIVIRNLCIKCHKISVCSLYVILLVKKNTSHKIIVGKWKVCL